MDSIAADSFSSMFNELSHSLILCALQYFDISAMSNAERSEFIDWLNYYNSPLPPPTNFHQEIAAFTRANRPDRQYSSQPLSSYPPREFSNGLIPNYHLLQQYTSPIPYHGPVGQPPSGIPQPIPTYSPMQPYEYAHFPVVDLGPFEYFDEVAVISAVDETSSYEDMLQLQERISYVNVGLSEETIFKNLKTRRISVAGNVKREADVCAVCQDEYKDNETIGTLDCRHTYHANCIKKWLLHKNVCPICKATALVI